MSKLRQWRQEQGLSQDQAGRAIGVSSVAWGRYEKGRVPDPDVLQRLIHFTGGSITANDFFNLPVAEQAAA